MIMCVLLCYPVSIHMSQLLSTGRPISSFHVSSTDCRHRIITSWAFKFFFSSCLSLNYRGGKIFWDTLLRS